MRLFLEFGDAELTIESDELARKIIQSSAQTSDDIREFFEEFL